MAHIMSHKTEETVFKRGKTFNHYSTGTHLYVCRFGNKKEQCNLQVAVPLLYQLVVFLKGLNYCCLQIEACGDVIVV